MKRYEHAATWWYLFDDQGEPCAVVEPDGHWRLVSTEKAVQTIKQDDFVDTIDIVIGYWEREIE